MASPETLYPTHLQRTPGSHHRMLTSEHPGSIGSHRKTINHNNNNNGGVKQQLFPNARYQNLKAARRDQDEQKIGKLYLNTKTNMLEIVQDGVKVNLELKQIKEQFVKLLKDANNEIDHQKNSTLKTSAPSPSKALSSARSRVKALYEAKKNRINARRSSFSSATPTTPTTKGAQSSKHWRRSVDHIETRDPEKENRLPGSSVPTRHHYIKRDSRYTRSSYQGRYQDYSHKTRYGPNRVTCSGQLLPPIREERGLKKLLQGCASPCVSKALGSTTFCESDGEYVTLKKTQMYSSTRSGFNSPHTPTNPPKVDCSTDTSVWNIDDEAAAHLKHKDHFFEQPYHDYDSSPEKMNTNIRFAKSNEIDQLYTSPPHKPSLRDVSNITTISRTTMRHIPSVSNFNFPLDNMSSYPLQSTFNYPLHSTMNNTNDFPDLSQIMDSPDKHDDHYDGSSSVDGKTQPCLNITRDSALGTSNSTCRDSSTKSLESIHALSHRQANTTILPPRRKQLTQPPVSVTTEKDTPIYVNKNTSMIIIPPNTRIMTSNVTHVPPSEPPIQEMCSCGLHPVCIKCSYDKNSDSPVYTDSSDEIAIKTHLVRSEGQRKRGEGRSTEKKPRRRRPSRNTVTDTDCDSSYLSGVDNEIPERSQDDEYTYDSAKGIMKPLRRQTADSDLKSKQDFPYPQALHESDLFMDATLKHMSLEATRSSLPDFSSLSTIATTTTNYNSDDFDTYSDSTIHASPSESTEDLLAPIKNIPFRSLRKCSREQQVPEQRPCSLATSAATNSSGGSPSSSSSGNNGLMEVPVNSPNITDSGSSSRPTTDDYAYMPLPVLSKEALLQHQMQYRPAAQRHYRRRRCSTRHITPYDSSSTSRCSSTIRGSSKHYYSEEWSEFSTPSSRKYRRRRSRDPSVDSETSSKHFTISDSDGRTRTIVKHSAVGRNLEPHRKKKLKRKLKQFNNLYHSTGNVSSGSIEVLGDF